MLSLLPRITISLTMGLPECILALAFMTPSSSFHVFNMVIASLGKHLPFLHCFAIQMNCYFCSFQKSFKLVPQAGEAVARQFIMQIFFKAAFQLC